MTEKRKSPVLRFRGYSDDWEQRKLNRVADFYTGNGLNWNDVLENGKQECILYGNLYTDYGMIADTVVYRTNAEIKNPVFSEFGDVLIPASDTTPTGLARATSIEKSGVLLGGDINIVRPKKDINGSCLSLAINANKSELIKVIKGTTVRHIHNSEIQGIEISLPTELKEQEKLTSYFKQLDNLITLHQRKLELRFFPGCRFFIQGHTLTWCPATKEQGIAGSEAPRSTGRNPILLRRRGARRRKNKII